QILDALQMEGLSPVKDMVGEILGFLPNLLGALVIFAIFYLVARIVQRLVTNLLASIGFNKLPQWLGLGEPEEGSASASSITGWIVMIVILFMGSIQAFNTLGLAIVSGLANELMQGLFSVLIAVVIFAIGLFLSRLAHKAITASGHRQAATLANVARFAILVLVGAMALHKTELAPEIVNLAFGALIVGISLAGGLAFGLGGREEAARVIESWSDDS
ncbi:MAG: mechanosensitive ion channel, partial [Acidobacteriota bacterium]